MPYIQYMYTKLGFDSSSGFYRAMLCWHGILAVVVCPSVCHTLVGTPIVAKRLKVESRKQNHSTGA